MDVLGLGIPTVVLAIIVANVLLSNKGFKDISFFNKYKFNVPSVRNGENIRFLSSGFLHVDMSHLLFNMLTLYFFAPVVTGTLGDAKFLVIYFAGLVIGNLMAFQFNKNNSYYSAVGASGAVMSVLYASIMIYPNMSLYMFFIPIPIPAWLFGIMYMLYTIYGMGAKNDRIGHDAHMGGAITGYVLALIFAPSILTQNLKMVILLAIPIVLLNILVKTGRIR